MPDQIRRAAGSVMANITEGFERDGTAEFIQFLTVAKASGAEVLSHFYVALDQAYIAQDEFDRMSATTGEVMRMIAALINYLRRSGVKGLKFKTPNSQVMSSGQELETRNRKP